MEGTGYTDDSGEGKEDSVSFGAGPGKYGKKHWLFGKKRDASAETSPDAADMEALAKRMGSGKYTVEEVKEARLGIEHGLSPEKVFEYFKPGLGYKVMEQIRLFMEAETSIQDKLEDGKKEDGKHE
jgi:hypothetical protein